MSITITEKDVGRTVVRRNGEKVKITRWHNDLGQQVEVDQSTLHNTDGFWLTSRKENERDIIAFVDEPAASALTEERIREIVREMMQPQPEKKEPRRGELWINVDADGYRTVYDSREDADEEKAHDRIACVKAEWTEGQGLEGEER